MAGFSGALQLTDLDDFITPSQVNLSEPSLYMYVSRIKSYASAVIPLNAHQQQRLFHVQACIKPIQVEKKAGKFVSNQSTLNQVLIEC